MMIGLTASVFARLLTMIGGSCLLIREFVPYDTWTRDGRYEPTYHKLRTRRDMLQTRQGGCGAAVDGRGAAIDKQ